MRFRVLFSAALLSTVSTLAMAQTYTNVISFGDSLTDNGNLIPGYRFSNGPTWAEVYAGMIKPQAGASTMDNVGAVVNGRNVNFAYGGARADNNPNSNGPIPSVQTQIGMYQAFGGVIGARSMVTVWAGANDIFQTIPVTPTVGAITAQTNASAAVLGGGLNALGAMGARNIMVMNLPDLGTTPAFAGGAAQALGTYATNNYNAQLAAQVSAARLANPTANIILVNVNAIGAAITANPAAFGFRDATTPCSLIPACAALPVAQQNQYFFWDGVHPTASAHALFARVAYAYSTYGTLASTTHSLGDVSLQNRYANLGRSSDSVASALFNQMPSEKGEMRLEATFDLFKGGNNNGRTAYNANLEGGKLSYSRSTSADVAFGLAGAIQYGSGTQGLLKYSPLAFSFDGWALKRFGQSYVSLTAGASLDNYFDYSRASGVGNLAAIASPTGSTLGAAIETGHSFKTGSAVLTPSARITALNSSTGAYVESGLVAPLSYAARSQTAFIASSEMRADMPLSSVLKGHGLVGYQHLLSHNGTSTNATLADNPVSFVATSLGAMQLNGVYVGAGLAGKVNGLNVRLDYRGSFVANGQHRVTGGVKLAF